MQTLYWYRLTYEKKYRSLYPYGIWGKNVFLGSLQQTDHEQGDRPDY